MTLVLTICLSLGALLLLLILFGRIWFPARPGDCQRIVFYDGECGLCNRSVRLLMAIDRELILRFAPLQGETAANLIEEEFRNPQSGGTMVYWFKPAEQPPEHHTRSTAILLVLKDVGGIWRPLGSLLLALPNRLRDPVYRWIAANRHRLFPRNHCPVTTAQEDGRFLP